MSEHTPGPWRWTHGGSALMADDILVTGIPRDAKPKPADAALIKAAPTMKEVLDDHYDTITRALGTVVASTDGNPETTEKMNRVKRDLDHAIAKAEGGSR